MDRRQDRADGATATAKAITSAIIEHWTVTAPDDRIAHLLRHVARGLRRSLELRLSEHDISFGQWSFLRILWHEDGLSQRELSLRAGVMAPTTHSAIHRMEAMGLVALRTPERGGKRPCVYLTGHGRALEAKLVPLAEEANRIALDGLGHEEVAALRRMLLRMVENLARDEIEGLESGLRVAPTRAQGRQGED